MLVGCEFSGVVRRAFRELGHDAWSCDILPASDDSPHHLHRDVRDVLSDGWDVAVFHPPCTHLAVSGARYFASKVREQAEALDFVRRLLDAPIPRIALENPVSVISSRIRKPDQIVQPWQFGHPESKTTCLWLKGLPPLRHTDVLPEPSCGYWSNQTPSGQNKLGPSPQRAALRATTYAGIAAAMADQWGGVR